MKRLNKNSIILYFIYIISFAFILGIMLCCPMINDDFSFLSYGFTNLKDMIHFSLYYGNGRLLGNVTSLMLIGYPVLFAVEKAVILFIIIALLPRALDFEHKCSDRIITYLASFVLIMGMSPFIFQEVITWSTCFQNYVIPVAGLIICIKLITGRNGKNSFLTCALIFIVGFTTQLYLELNTVVNVALAFVIAFLCFIKYKEKLAKSIVFLISTVSGALMMFAIPKLFIDPERVEKMKAYRAVHLENFSDFKYTLMNNTGDLIMPVKKCVFLLVILAVLLCIIVRMSGKKCILTTVIQTGVIALPVYAIVFQILLESGDFAGKNAYRIVYNILLALFVVCAFISIGYMEKSVEKKFATVSLMFVIVSILPVTIVSPVKPRCAYLYYMFLTALTVILLNYLIKKKKISKEFKIGVVICAVVLMFNLGINLWNVKLEAEKQIKDIEVQIASGSEVVEVHQIDNFYMHKIAKGMFGYLYYHEKPFDVEFNYVD